MKTTTILLTMTALTGMLFVSCGDKEKDTDAGGDSAGASSLPAQPGGMDGAKTVLNELLKNPDKGAELSKKLRPTKADYAAVFADTEFAAAAEESYGKAWDGGALVIGGKPGQTELKLWSATGADLKDWNEKSNAFPGGYKRVAKYYKDDVTIYRFKFVKPGEELGMAYDGLIHVNGQWRIFPKPWRMVK